MIVCKINVSEDMAIDKEMKINIGCGLIGKSDWINLDWGLLPLLSKIPFVYKFLVKITEFSFFKEKWPENLYLHDCRKGLPFGNNSVDYIYSSHFIEHLPRYLTVKFLSECHRILKVDGLIRISVPDLNILVNKYLQNDKKFFENLFARKQNSNLRNIADLFVACFYGEELYLKQSFFGQILRLFARNHLWMYDYQSLRSILKEAGFSDVRRYQPGFGKVPDIEYLDNHRTSSIFLECKKTE